MLSDILNPIPPSRAVVVKAVAAYIAANPIAPGGPTQAQVNAAIAAYFATNTPAVKVVLPNIIITQNAVIAISAGVRAVQVACAGVLAGDFIELAPTAALPAGYALHGAVATAANVLVVTLTGPLLAIGASYAITCKALALR